MATGEDQRSAHQPPGRTTVTSRARTALWAVFAATCTVRIGFGGILPVLPIYAEQHGMTPWLIAVMTNAYMLSNVLCQSAAGQMGDRWGRRPVLLAGLGLYTLAMALFTLDGAAWYYIALRGIEGLGASAFGPTVRAFVADLVPEGERGRAFARLTSFDMAGFLFGPVFGGVAQGLFGPRAPFALSALLSLLAGLPVLLFAHGYRPSPTTGETPAAGQAPLALRLPLRRVLVSTAFWVVSLPSIGFGYLVGLYNVVWSLYMQAAGSTPWQISLSYTAWALPAVVLTLLFGSLADRVSRPLLMGIGGGLSTLVTLLYALLPFPLPLIILSGVDGAGGSLFIPASQAYMAEVAPERVRGHFFGLVGALSTAAAIGAGLLVGYLYEHVAPIWLFGLGATCLSLTVGSAVWLMLRRPPALLRSSLETLAAEAA